MKARRIFTVCGRLTLAATELSRTRIILDKSLLAMHIERADVRS